MCFSTKDVKIYRKHTYIFTERSSKARPSPPFTIGPSPGTLTMLKIGRSQASLIYFLEMWPPRAHGGPIVGLELGKIAKLPPLGIELGRLSQTTLRLQTIPHN